MSSTLNHGKMEARRQDSLGQSSHQPRLDVADATDKWGRGVGEIEGGTWLSVIEREERGERPCGLLCLGRPATKPREKRECSFYFFLLFQIPIKSI
jgi:hypothetical protein